MAHNLNQLRVLAALLNHPNLTHVGNQLHMTQSAVSKTLAQLRDAFGDELLVRDGQQYLLTSKALQLKQELPTRLEALETLYRPEQFNPALCERQFVMASSDYVAEYIFPDIVAKVAEQAPNVTLAYQPWHKSKLADIADLPIDIVSTLVEAPPENCFGLRQGEDKLAVLMNQNHPLSQSLSLQEYLAASHLLVTGGGDKDSLVDQALKLQNQQRNITLQVPFFSTAIVLLQQTQHLLTTPLHIAVQMAQSAQLAWQPLPVTLPAQQYHLLWHQRFQQDPAHQWFRELAFPVLQGHVRGVDMFAKQF